MNLPAVKVDPFVRVGPCGEECKGMNAREACEFLAGWIATQVKSAGALGTVVGVSGGVDSAVVLALCKRAVGPNVLGIVMPCHSQKEDIDDAMLVLDHFGVERKVVVLDGVFDEMMKALGEGDVRRRDLCVVNVRPRLRMATLYYHANKMNYLVAGTGNRSELEVGYFTKYGDGGVDILPIGGLVKTQVREIAANLGVPSRIIEKPPTAGLWPGQTDEGEMGITYRDIDDYLLTGRGDPGTVARIRLMHDRSEHKRKPLPIPDMAF